MLATGLAVGLDSLPGLQFDPHKSCSGCRICGTVLQRDIDRFPERFMHNPGFDGNLQLVEEYATASRRLWCSEHYKTHSEKEHQDLADSGRWCTPEAAVKLAAFGFVHLGDLVLDDEIADVLGSASPVPTEDALSAGYVN